MVSLVAANDQNVRLVDDNYLALADLLVVHFEAGPLELFEVIKCMLVEFGEVEELLTDRTAIVSRAWLTGLGLVHAPQVLDLLLGRLELRCQILYTVVINLLLAAVDTDEAAMLAAEDYHRTLVLVRE